MSRFTFFAILLVMTLGAFGICSLQSTLAGQISIAEFTPAAVVQDFEGLPNGSVGPSLLLDGDEFIANDYLIEISSKLGPAIGRTGVAIGNRSVSVPSEQGFIDIEFGNPALRAGLYVGVQAPWSAVVDFYDTGNDFVGSIPLSGVGRDSSFAGWEADSGLIGRIRVTDVINDGHSLTIDDFVTEIPEPTALWVLFGFGSIVSLLLSRNSARLSWCEPSAVGQDFVKGVRNVTGPCITPKLPDGSPESRYCQECESRI